MSDGEIRRTVVRLAAGTVKLGFLLFVLAGALTVSTPVFGVLWLLILSVVLPQVGPSMPSLGLLARVGLPVAVGGVPLVFPAALGFVTAAVAIGYFGRGRGSGPSGGFPHYHHQPGFGGDGGGGDGE